MWQHQRSPFGRAAHIRNARGLTQLYNDAKLTCENVTNSRRNAAANSPYDQDPEVLALRKDFQEQQDRLLAWGMHWADKQASGNAASKGKEAGFDIDIDTKVDQAGLGEVVASIMENIRSTLARSGQLQHPGRWKENRAASGGTGGAWSAFQRGMVMEKFSGSSPRADKRDWKDYELTTGRELLDKLRESIDLLYALDTEQEDTATSSKLDKEKAATESFAHMTPVTNAPAMARTRHTVDDALDVKELAHVAHQLQSHPLYIDFSQLKPMHDPDAAAEPPTYEEAKENTTPIQPKSIYFFPAMQSHVLVDLARARNYPIIPEPMTVDDPFRHAHELAQLVSGKGLLTWDGHLKLLGFTLAHANSRFGLVYALPVPNDPTALQASQTLMTSINATLEHEMSFPPLEDKFRLAYNIALSATSYLAHNACHGHIKSSNIIFLRENDNPKLGKALRCPYILQPVQQLVGEPSFNQPLHHTIYHHADADEAGYGVVPAYDIYSVGLILLEIGLWRPLHTFWKQKYDRALFHEKLRKHYIPKLASKCGTQYMKVVQACFDAPEHLQDKPSPIDAAELLLEMVEALGKCCAIDEAGSPSELDIEVFESLIESQRLDHPQPSKSAAMSSGSALNPSSAPQARPAPMKKTTSMSKAKQKVPGALKKWPDMDIPRDHLETWNNMLMPRLSKMLEKALKNSVESCSISLMMIGSTPEKAKTTICVQCPDTARIRQTLCDRFKPKSGWGLVVCAGDVKRSGQIRRKPMKRGSNVRRSGADTDHNDSNTEKTREQLYQPWPGCGASIGVWTDEQHLPPVSFGGTILVDGKPYGMTVHHMLDDPDDVQRTNHQAGPDIPKRSTVPRSSIQTALMEADNHFLTSDEDLPDAMDELELYNDSELVDTSEDEDMSDAESDASTIRPDYSLMDEEGSEFFIMEDSDDEDDDPPDLEDDEGHSSEESDEEAETGSIGDTQSISADRFDDEDYCVTQPAFDDVPGNFFSDEPEYRDEEHLLSHSFGLVHASSGIKRITRNSMKHEVDWALIRINEQRLNLTVNPEVTGPASRQSSRSSKLRKRKNSSLQGGAFSEPQLTSITPLTAMPKLQVNCVGRTSGKSSGRISAAMSLLKLPGRRTFSASFTVEGGMGVPGDSGAWVYSEERKELCGHILAWSDSLNQAFIAPMEVLFEDLKERLGAQEIRLPAQTPAPPSNVASTFQQQTSTSTVGTIDENEKGKHIIQNTKEHTHGNASSTTNSTSTSSNNSDLTAKILNLSLNTNTNTDAANTTTTPHPRSHSRSRASSTTSRHDRARDETSPMSASSSFARRSRAEPVAVSVPRTQSPTQILAAPTPSPTSVSTSGQGTAIDVKSCGTRKDVYGFDTEFGGGYGVGVTRAVPS